MTETGRGDLQSLELEVTVGRYRVHFAGGVTVLFDLHLSGGDLVTFESVPAWTPRAIREGQEYRLLWVRCTRGPHTPGGPRLRRNQIMVGDTCQVQVWAGDGDYEVDLPPVERIETVHAPLQVIGGPDDSLQWVNLHRSRGESVRMVCTDGTIVDIDTCNCRDAWATITHPATEDRLAKEELKVRLLWVTTFVRELADGLVQTLSVGHPSDLYLDYGRTIGHVRLAPTATLILIAHDPDQAGNAS